jgi:hypothetical protein
VIRHLPINTPAEDICEGLVSLGFDVVNVKQMTTTRRSPPEEPKLSNLALFLVTLPRKAKSQQIFQLPSLCHSGSLQIAEPPHAVPQLSAVRPRLGKLQTASTLFMVRGWPPAQRMPERVNTASTPACCNCQLAEGGKPHLANYRGCRRAR